MFSGSDLGPHVCRTHTLLMDISPVPQRGIFQMSLSQLNGLILGYPGPCDNECQGQTSGEEGVSKLGRDLLPPGRNDSEPHSRQFGTPSS